MIFSVVVVH